MATRATDLDRKDAQVQSDRATEKSQTESFILNLKNRDWMKTEHFTSFLNRMTQTRCKSGGVWVKKTKLGTIVFGLLHYAETKA